ncbi:MAG: hypothetical protein OQK78_04920 [Gammaproteobacteria bacterium]|nr:hypothetical protein [Gammaproteobacteria bacterium]
MGEANELLLWAKGPAFEWALGIMIFGIVIRLIEIFSLGRRVDYSVARENSPGSGLKTIFSRSYKVELSTPQVTRTVITGYIFHIGLLITVALFIPHIEIWRSIIGFGWPGLPTSIVDFVAVITMLTLLVVLVDRLTNPVKKQLSTIGDYLAWLVTFLPLLTGYLTYHHLGLPYTEMLAIHIISVELLMIILPFTKLIHSVTIFIARWYNGDQFARKGVAS